MNSGELRHPITIQQPTTGAPDAYGDAQPAYVTFAARHAKIEPLSGRILEYARAFSATATHQVTIRYLAGILPGFRVLYLGRTFAIDAAIDHEERRRELRLLCTEKL